MDVIILAGGRGSRLGGEDKAGLELGGRRLVDRAVAAGRAAGGRVLVIGPEHAGANADLVLREQPEFAGPLAALAAGLEHVASEQVLVLSCDLVHPEKVASALLAARSGPDGVVLADEDGREQWLSARYCTAALRDACARIDVVNAPVRRALQHLVVATAAISNNDSADIDTPQALETARAQFKEQNMAAHLPPEALEPWLAAAAEELGLDTSSIDIGTILGVAGKVAHSVARPAAPLSTFLLGYAMAQSGQELAPLAAQLNARAERWAAEN